MSEMVDANRPPTDDSGSNGGSSAGPDAGESPRVVSAKKLEANRRNAQRSTGPRTQEGKERVRWNAVKHGLLAKEVVLHSGKTGEDKAEFRRLLESLVDELQPVGMLEHICIERMAVALWRLRRAVRAEAGKLCQGRRRKESRIWTASADKPAAPLIRQILDELTAGPALSAETQERLEEMRISSPDFGNPLAKLVAQMQSAATKYATTDAAQKQAASEAWTSAAAALRALLEAQEDAGWRSATADVKIMRVAAAIPAPDAVAHLGRYETMHSRELDRVMARLAELQRRRKEEEEARREPAPDFAKQTHRAG